MCLKCTAPNNRYYVLDLETRLLVCEECGFAVKDLTEEAKNRGDYIWVFNPRWPRFRSFSQLLNIIIEDETRLPACTQFGFIPSRLLTAALDFLCETGTKPS